MAYRTFKLEVAYPKFDGQSSKGTVEIECSEPVVVDAAGNRILSGKVVVKLDDYGTAEVTLPDPSDTSLNPAGFGYTVTPNLHHGRLASVSFGAEAIVDGVVKLASVTPVDPSTFDPEATYAPLATVNELGDRVSTLETTPAVTSYNDLTDKPTIPATATDVGAEPAGLSAETEAALSATIAAEVPAHVPAAVADTINTLWIPASDFHVHIGGPVPASVGVGTPGFLFDAAAAEQVGMGVMLPSWWTSVNVRFVWCNYGTGTGNVRWRTVYQQNGGAGSSILDGPVAPTGIVATAAGQYVRVDTQMVAALPITGPLFSLRAWREADNATDTLANDVALLGVIVEAAA